MSQLHKSESRSLLSSVAATLTGGLIGSESDSTKNAPTRPTFSLLSNSLAPKSTGREQRSFSIGSLNLSLGPSSSSSNLQSKSPSSEHGTQSSQPRPRSSPVDVSAEEEAGPGANIPRALRLPMRPSSVDYSHVSSARSSQSGIKSIQPLTNEHFFEYFAVVGLGSRSGVIEYKGDGIPVYSPDIIVRYPQEDKKDCPLHEQLPLFCHHSGIQPLEVAMDYHSEPTVTTFILTGLEDSSRLYATKLTFLIPYDGDAQQCPSPSTGRSKHVRSSSVNSNCSSTSESSTSSAVSSPSSPSVPSDSISEVKMRRHNSFRKMSMALRKITERIPVCFCLLSRYPLFDLQGKILRSLHQKFQEGLQNAPPVVKFSETLEYVVLKEIIPIISEYIRKGVFPNTFRSQIVFDRSKDASGEFISYTASPILDFPVADFSLRAILNHISETDIILVLRYLLAERSVLLYSQKYQHLTIVAQTLTTLMYPFRFPFVYAPCLPASFVDFIYAPTPFFMGIHASAIGDVCQKLQELPDVCFVDLDNRNVHVSKSFSIPGFPLKPTEDLLNDIRHIYDHEEDGFGDDMLFSLRLRRAFLDFFSTIFRSYRDFITWCREDPTLNTFDNQSFLSSCSEDFQEFLSMFIETTTFTDFVCTYHPDSMSIFNDYLDLSRNNDEQNMPVFYQYFQRVSDVHTLSRSPDRPMTGHLTEFHASTESRTRPSHMKRDDISLFVANFASENFPASLNFAITRLPIGCDSEKFMNALKIMKPKFELSLKSPTVGQDIPQINSLLEQREYRVALMITIVEYFRDKGWQLPSLISDLISFYYNSLLDLSFKDNDYKVPTVIMELALKQFHKTPKMECISMVSSVKHQPVWQKRQFWATAFASQENMIVSLYLVISKRKQRMKSNELFEQQTSAFEELSRLMNCMIKYEYPLKEIEKFMNKASFFYGLSQEDAKELTMLAPQLYKVRDFC